MAARILKNTVQRIIRGLGENAPAKAIGNTSQTVQLAVDAVNDAIQDIYGRAQWDFRLKMFPVTLQAGNCIYILPDDFAEPQMADIPIMYGTKHIAFKPYVELMKAHPEWAMIWGGTQWGASAGVPPSVWGNTAILNEQDQKGEPEIWTVWNRTMYIWPPPSQEYIDAHGVTVGFSKSAYLMVPYYRTAVELSADTDAIPLPPELWPACTYLAQAYLKQALEFKDFSADEQRAERMIQKQIAKKTKRSPMKLRFKVR